MSNKCSLFFTKMIDHIVRFNYATALWGGGGSCDALIHTIQNRTSDWATDISR